MTTARNKPRTPSAKLERLTHLMLKLEARAPGFIEATCDVIDARHRGDLPTKEAFEAALYAEAARFGFEARL
jgi:hypothetical protein